MGDHKKDCRRLCGECRGVDKNHTEECSQRTVKVQKFRSKKSLKNKKSISKKYRKASKSKRKQRKVKSAKKLKF
jgi:hypothetical protein